MVWKIGVIGYGFSSKVFHIPFIRILPQFELAAIVQRHPVPENDASKDFPDIEIYHDVESFLQNDAIDIVVITIPLDSHFSLTKAALESRKHVICEKPFTPTSQEAGYLVDLANGQDRVLAVYHNRRWDADFVTVGSVIRDGTLGKITTFHSNFELDRPSHLRPDFPHSKISPFALGAIQNVGTHLIDQAIYLFGLPDKINASFDEDLREDASTDAVFTVSLEYDEGPVVIVNAGKSDPENPLPRFWTEGDKGTFTKFSRDVQKEHLALGMSPTQDGFAEDPVELFGTFSSLVGDTWAKRTVPTVKSPTWAGYYREFACAVDGQGKSPVSGMEAQSVIKIIELAVQSYLAGEKQHMKSK